MCDPSGAPSHLPSQYEGGFPVASIGRENQIQMGTHRQKMDRAMNRHLVLGRPPAPASQRQDINKLESSNLAYRFCFE